MVSNYHGCCCYSFNRSTYFSMKIGPEQSVQMPMKTVISLIIMVSLGTMGYFQIQEKLNQHDTLLQMHTKDLDQNSEFRIKYPRGELGQSSGESELFMLVEHMAEKIPNRVPIHYPPATGPLLELVSRVLLKK